MKNVFWVLLIASTVFSFGQVQYRMSGSGLKFFFANDQKGNTAELGQLVSLHMMINDASGQEIKNSYATGKPIMFPVKLSVFEGDIYEAVSMMSEGDSALFQIKADSMYAQVFRTDVPAHVTPESFLDVNIRVFKIWNQKDRIAELRENKTSEFTLEEVKRIKEEKEMLEQYIAQEDIIAQKTPLGVYYLYYKKGKGKVKAQNGKTMLVNYTGKLLDGRVFETNVQEDGLQRPISFEVGQGQVIPAWDDIAPLLKEGDSVMMIVPSHLAFGALSKGDLIQPNTPLIFELDVRGVR